MIIDQFGILCCLFKTVLFSSSLTLDTYGAIINKVCY